MHTGRHGRRGLGQPCQPLAEQPQVACAQQAQQQRARRSSHRRPVQQPVQLAAARCRRCAGALQQALQPSGRRLCPCVAPCRHGPPQQRGQQRRGQGHCERKEGQGRDANSIRVRLACTVRQKRRLISSPRRIGHAPAAQRPV